MRKLQFKEFNSHQGLTKFVNDENIEPDEIASLSSFPNPNAKLSSVKVYFHLFYWGVPKENEEKVKNDDARIKEVMDNVFPLRNYDK